MSEILLKPVLVHELAQLRDFTFGHMGFAHRVKRVDDEFSRAHIARERTRAGRLKPNRLPADLELSGERFVR